jgi:hypothetical protein
MKSYTFYMHDADHPTPAFDFVHCDNDDEACAHARVLLDRFPEYEAIEVFDGMSTRVSVRRGPASSTVSARPHAVA